MDIQENIKNFHELYVILKDSKQNEIKGRIFHDKKYTPEKLFILQNKLDGGTPVIANWRNYNYDYSWEFGTKNLLQKLLGEEDQTEVYVTKITTDADFQNEIDIEETWNQQTIILKQIKWYHKLERGTYLTHIGNEHCPKGLVVPALFSYINDNLFEGIVIPSEYIKENFRFSTINEIKILKSHLSDSETYILKPEEIDNIEDKNDLEFIVNENIKKPKFPLIDDSCIVDMENQKNLENVSGITINHIKNYLTSSASLQYITNGTINKSIQTDLLSVKSIKFSYDIRYDRYAINFPDCINKLLNFNKLTPEIFHNHFDFTQTDYNYKYSVGEKVIVKYADIPRMDPFFSCIRCVNNWKSDNNIFINNFIIKERLAGMYVLQNTYIKDFVFQVFECFLAPESKELKKINYKDAQYGRIYSHSLLPPYSYLFFNGKKFLLCEFFPKFVINLWRNPLKLTTLIEIPHSKFDEYVGYSKFITQPSNDWLLKQNILKPTKTKETDLHAELKSKLEKSYLEKTANNTKKLTNYLKFKILDIYSF